LKIDQFDFHLPPERIAQTPADPRDSARLLRVAAPDLAHLTLRDLPDLLSPGDLLVVNDTKVIRARLRGHRDAVAIEILLHMRLGLDRWRCFAKPAKRLKIGQTITFAEDFAADIQGKNEDGTVDLHFNAGDEAFFAALERHGELPLPPYIRRDAPEATDAVNYQTTFAREPGAVAAPTAGLHFTPDLLARLESRGIQRQTLTLHVGAGTFLPVKADDTDDHQMHAEIGFLSQEAADRINATRARGGKIIAVGTTSLRLLESAAGEDGRMAPFTGETRLFVTPGYRFKVVDRLLTNFHLPKSTLFILVSAFCGLNRMQAAYREAISLGYRFYSYGDACLLDRIDADQEPEAPLA